MIKSNDPLLKIEEFKKFNEGRHFGEGVAPSKEVADIATRLVKQAIEFSLDTDVFPGIAGEIMVTVYHKDYYLEFTIENNKKITYVYEENDEEIDCIESLTIKDSLIKLQNFNNKKCNISGIKK